MKVFKLFYSVVCSVVFGTFIYLFNVPPTNSQSNYDWYMVDFKIFKRPCSLMAVCLSYRVRLMEIVLELSISEPNRLDGYPSTTTLQKQVAMWKLNIEAFAKATTVQVYENSYHSHNNRRECSFNRIRQCETELHNEMYRQCEKTFRNLNFKDGENKCLKEFEPLHWDFYRMIVIYFGTGQIGSAASVYKDISKYYPDIYIHGSHGYLLRLQNRTHQAWLDYEKSAWTDFKITSMCKNQVHAICVYRKKPLGDVECYDNRLTNVPCWGEKSKPAFLKHNLKYGRGRSRVSSAEVPPYLSAGSLDNFD